MGALGMIVALAIAAPLFERIDIALPAKDPAAVREVAIIPANANNDKIGDAIILNGYDLLAYDLRTGTQLWSMRLEAGVSAFDVADVDLDGYPEVIAVRGNTIQRYPTRISAEPEVIAMFEQASLYADERIQPYPQALVTERQGQILIGLLMESGMEYFTITGTRAASESDDDERERYITHFSTFADNRTFIGPRDGLEFNILRTIVVETPEEPSEEHESSGRRGTARQTLDAAAEEASRWPWFSIKRDEPEALRALYAAAEGQFDLTQIRIRQYTAPEEGAETPTPAAQPIKVSPPRKYPGTLIDLAEDMPDFNGDGYNDLLLWKAKAPGTSVDAIARAASAGVWPIRLTTHHYAPTRHQYAAEVKGVVSLNVPLGWLLEMEDGAPLRFLVVEDFNGDGKTDIACGTGERSFSVWLSDDGFESKPDYSVTFSTPLREVSFSADLNGDGRTAIGLRSTDALHVLHYIAPDKHASTQPIGNKDE